MLFDYIKTAPHWLLPKQSLTMLAGYLANVSNPKVKNFLIKRFIEKYSVNMNEALEENPDNYDCFNDFFIRQLKPECRPVSTAGIISPVDGYVSQIGRISTGTLLQAKMREYSVNELLACDEALGSQFQHGSYATLYLSPQDYHRVHMPVDGTLLQTIYVPGKLFSVQPQTTQVIPRLFARNERLVAIFDTQIGAMAMVLVGATIVGAIGTSWQGDIPRGRKKIQTNYDRTINKIVLNKASEMGYFKLGSTVILLFAEGKSVQWDPKWQPGNKIRFGEALVKNQFLSDRSILYST